MESTVGSVHSGGEVFIAVCLIFDDVSKEILHHEKMFNCFYTFPNFVLQAIDDDCNQTGQMLSALLSWPQVINDLNLILDKCYHPPSQNYFIMGFSCTF